MSRGKNSRRTQKNLAKTTVVAQEKKVELKAATGLPAAASFKHVSPAGAAVATEKAQGHLQNRFS